MRSRYTAFVRRDFDYLYRTVASEQRKDGYVAELERSVDDAKWLGLEVRAAKDGGPADETGTVEYVARLEFKGRKHALHELSSFRREEGAWVYVDGEMNPKQPPATRAETPGRNDPCICGSGKKYKKCCGK